MNVRPEALAKALERGLAPLTWIHGDEPLLAIEAADQVRAAARAQGFDERLVMHVERGFTPDQLTAQASAMSLFAARKLIDLRIASRPNREIGDALSTLAPRLDGDVRILVSSARLDRAATQSAWFRALDPSMLHVAIYPVERARLAEWIGARLAAQGQRADAQTLNLIAERVEGNLLAAHQEIRKLALLFGRGALPPDEARDAVLNVARYDPFSLLDAVLVGDVERTRRSIDGLRAEGAAEPLVLFALADGARTLTRVLEACANGVAIAAALAQSRVFGPREAAYRRALARHDLRSARQSLQAAARADTIIKGIRAGDSWQALGDLALAMAGAPLFGEP